MSFNDKVLGATKILIDLGNLFLAQEKQTFQQKDSKISGSQIPVITKYTSFYFISKRSIKFIVVKILHN